LRIGDLLGRKPGEVASAPLLQRTPRTSQETSVGRNFEDRAKRL